MPATPARSAPRASVASLAQLRRRLGLAMRAYERLGVGTYAAAAALHLHELLAHPQFRVSPAERCAARAIARRWQALAWCSAR
ncbi:hypothetical protein HUS23_06510 [Ectothiorhodospiraceae bacterium 2226]|nr:hypothetical protein HUS23_06510 [Ectothiorhodospiraceae bacterium 2226]